MNALKKEYNKLKKLHINLARRDLLNFTTYTNAKYIPNWHHKYVANVLTEFITTDKIKKLMIFMPPQHGKSELASRNLPAFAFGINPDLKIAGVSYSIDLQRLFNRDIQRIMISDEYKAIFPKVRLNEKGVLSSQNYLRNSDEFDIVGHRGSYKAVGVMGGLSGRPVDILLLDDTIKDALQAYSAVYRERIWDWYLSVGDSRLHNDSKQIICMTRWHEDDLAGRLLDAEGDEWTVIKFLQYVKNRQNMTKERSVKHFGKRGIR